MKGKRDEIREAEKECGKQAERGKASLVREGGKGPNRAERKKKSKGERAGGWDGEFWVSQSRLLCARPVPTFLLSLSHKLITNRLSFDPILTLLSYYIRLPC